MHLSFARFLGARMGVSGCFAMEVGCSSVAVGAVVRFFVFFVAGRSSGAHWRKQTGMSGCLYI